MIWRRRKKKSRSLAYKRAAPFGIGQTVDEAREIDDARTSAVIQATRQEVFALRATCQLCGGRRRAECLGLSDQMHEEPPRSKTRGLPAADRFNLRVCGRLCVACHRDVTEKRIVVVFVNPLLGFIGPVMARPGGSRRGSGDSSDGSWMP